MLRNVIFCNKFEWFSIICFSLSFPCLACKSVFAFSELDTQNHPGLIDLKWDESVHCWTALRTVLCMFWHFSSFFKEGNPWDYRWTLTGEAVARLVFFVDRHWMWRKDEAAHLDATERFSMGRRRDKQKKGKNDLFTAELPVGTLWSTLRIDSARSIGLKFIWYWTRVEILCRGRLCVHRVPLLPIILT